jgi:hypothetical protein
MKVFFTEIISSFVPTNYTKKSGSYGHFCAPSNCPINSSQSPEGALYKLNINLPYSGNMARKLPLASRIEVLVVCCIQVSQHRFSVNDTSMRHITPTKGLIKFQLHSPNRPLHPQLVVSFEKVHKAYTCVCCIPCSVARTFLLNNSKLYPGCFPDLPL